MHKSRAVDPPPSAVVSIESLAQGVSAGAIFFCSSSGFFSMISFYSRRLAGESVFGGVVLDHFSQVGRGLDSTRAWVLRGLGGHKNGHQRL